MYGATTTETSKTDSVDLSDSNQGWFSWKRLLILIGSLLLVGISTLLFVNKLSTDNSNSNIINNVIADSNGHGTIDKNDEFYYTECENGDEKGVLCSSDPECGVATSGYFTYAEAAEVCTYAQSIITLSTDCSSERLDCLYGDWNESYECCEFTYDVEYDSSDDTFYCQYNIYYCETDGWTTQPPSQAPTQIPTTAAPTRVPTVPTVDPTNSPTGPTTPPTPNPTHSPTVPTLAPSYAPTVTPTPCFCSESDIIKLNEEEGLQDTVKLKDVKVGDYVLSGINNEFSKVKLIVHENEEEIEASLMRQLCFFDDECYYNQSITLSYNHLLYINGTNYYNIKSAFEANIGDYVWNHKISNLTQIIHIKENIYIENYRWIGTENGNIIVNGILASNFVSGMFINATYDHFFQYYGLKILEVVNYILGENYLLNDEFLMSLWQDILYIIEYINNNINVNTTCTVAASTSGIITIAMIQSYLNKQKENH